MDQGFRAWATKFAERVAGRFDADFLHKTVLSFQFLPEVIEKDRFQPETEMPIWTYLQKTCSSDRVAQGQQLLTKFQTSLDEIVLLMAYRRRFYWPFGVVKPLTDQIAAAFLF